jgi:short-subunit dehydrogenase
MLKQLQGANAVLTGGSQGIGPYIARTLVAQGINLALVARNQEKLEGVAAELRGSGARVVTVPADLTEAGVASEIVLRCERELGPVDILINNAGLENGGSFSRKSAEEIQSVLLTNLSAPLLLAHAVLPGMLQRGRGHIVNIASLAGKMAMPYAATYSASKAALMAWGTSVRVELHGSGVSCTTVSPGFIAEAGMFASHNSGPPPAYLSQSRPEDVAEGVLRALREDPIEVVVSGRPIKPLQVAYALAPGLLLKAMRRLGLFDFLRKNFHE